MSGDVEQQLRDLKAQQTQAQQRAARLQAEKDAAHKAVEGAVGELKALGYESVEDALSVAQKQREDAHRLIADAHRSLAELET